MNTTTPLLCVVDQLNTEKLTRIQTTVELMSAKAFKHNNKISNCWTAAVNRFRARLEYIKAVFYETRGNAMNE